jgi:hypothetical protein
MPKHRLSRLLVLVIAVDVTAFVIAFALRHAKHGLGETIGAIAWFTLWGATAAAIALAVAVVVRRRRPRATATLLAVVTVLCASAVANAAHTSSSHAQRFVLYSANVKGADAPVVVQAAGVVSGVGSETQTEKPARGGEINYATLHLKGGTLRLVAPERFAWNPNLASCSATAAGGGTWRIVAGTGAYRTTTGHGTFTSRGVLLGARDGHGACLGEKAQPVVNYVTVVLTGIVRS